MEQSSMRYHQIIESTVSPFVQFWYRPSDGTFEDTEGMPHGDHAYNMGYGDINLGTEETLALVLNDGWVRGRYGRKTGVDWDNGNQSDLSLQGRRDLVLKTARYIAAHHAFNHLYLDFTINGNVHDAMESIQLHDDQLETYLRRGVIRK
jgi:hypothetical protein